MVVSLGGSIAPAVIGLLGTLIASTQIDNHLEIVSLLTIWTILGYLSLSDFGLSRTATRLTAGVPIADGRGVVVTLWKPAIAVGVAMACGLAAVLAVFTAALHVGDARALWFLVLIPPVAAMQFPVVGFLEAQGRWLTIASNRVSVATYTYLVPAVLLAFGSTVSVVVIVVVVGRCISFALLALSAGVRLFGPRIGTSGDVRIGSILTWVGASSLIGPGLLYADRLVLATMPIRVDQWAFYVFVSELALKTYVIPSAVISVLYPWLLRNLSVRAGCLQRLMSWKTVGPIAIAMALSVAATSLLLPEGSLSALGLSDTDMNMGRIVLALLIGSTILNWVSQLWIAVLHATDGQQQVVVIQLALVVPYGCVLAGAWFAGGVIAVAGAFALRILVTWALLHSHAARAVTIVQRAVVGNGPHVPDSKR